MKSKSRDQVLLLGNGRQSLAVVRQLHPQGWQPVVGINGVRDRNVVHRSRWVAGTWRHTDWTADAAGFRRDLLTYIAGNDRLAAVFPVNSQALRHVCAVRHQLPAEVTPVLPGREAVELFLDKQATYELCRTIGIPVADYHVAQGLPGLQQAATTIGLPCVIKPLDQAELVFGIKAAVVKDRNTYEGWLRDDRLAGQRMMVQQFVDYPRYNVHFAARAGRLLAAAVVLVRSTDRLDGTGFAVSGVTVEPSHGLRADCEALVAATDYTGVGCAQWLAASGSDKRIFLELNPRLGGNFKSVEPAGLALAPVALQLALDEADPPPDDPWAYRRGVRFAWSSGALAGCRFELRTGTIDRRMAARILMRSLFDAAAADTHVTWTWRDPLPTIAWLLRPLTGESAIRKHRKEARQMKTPAAAPRQTDRGGR